MILGVLALAAIILLAVGVGLLIGWLPERIGIVQRIVAQAPQLSDRIAGRVAQVIVVPKSAWGALGALRARLIGKG
jgi:TRAP-type C4-dicarboxylate transport system permease large subunit